jgi:hypothetical protein
MAVICGLSFTRANKIGLDNHNGPGIRELSNVSRSGFNLTTYCPNFIGNRVILDDASGSLACLAVFGGLGFNSCV